MDDDTFNIERQYEPAPGRWQLVIPWMATTGRSVFTSGTIPSVVGSIGSLQEAQIRWERSISSEMNSSLWPPPYG